MADAGSWAEIGSRGYLDPFNDEIPAEYRTARVVVLGKWESAEPGRLHVKMTEAPGHQLSVRPDWILRERRGTFVPVYEEVPGPGRSGLDPPRITGWVSGTGPG